MLISLICLIVNSWRFLSRLLIDDRVLAVSNRLFEMADYNDKCTEDCSFDFSEDKQKGVCLIKEE